MSAYRQQTTPPALSVYFYSFLALLMLACAIPHRKVIHP